jgi:hypothetical protein
MQPTLAAASSQTSAGAHAAAQAALTVGLPHARLRLAAVRSEPAGRAAAVAVVALPPAAALVRAEHLCHLVAVAPAGAVDVAAAAAAGGGTSQSVSQPVSQSVHHVAPINRAGAHVVEQRAACCVHSMLGIPAHRQKGLRRYSARAAGNGKPQSAWYGTQSHKPAALRRQPLTA